MILSLYTKFNQVDSLSKNYLLTIHTHINPSAVRLNPQPLHPCFCNRHAKLKIFIVRRCQFTIPVTEVAQNYN